MKLQCPSLFEQSAYIGGVWADDTSMPRVSVTNPSTHEIIGSVPQVTAQQVDEAIACAKTAFSDWREWSSRERALVLREWAHLVESHRDDLAIILCSEQGKPLHEARAEITQAANYLDWFAEETRRIYGDNLPAPRRNQRIPGVAPTGRGVRRDDGMDLPVIHGGKAYRRGSGGRLYCNTSSRSSNSLFGVGTVCARRERRVTARSPVGVDRRSGAHQKCTCLQRERQKSVLYRLD